MYTEVCDLRISSVDFALVYAAGSPILLALLASIVLNVAAFFRRRIKHPAAAENADERVMRITNPMDAHLSFLDEAAIANVGATDTLGGLGRSLHAMGLQWIRSPRSNCKHLVFRVFFISWSIFTVAALIVVYQRRLLVTLDPAFKKATFLNTFNQCAQICRSAAKPSCPAPVSVTLACTAFTIPNFDFLECTTSGSALLVSFMRTGVAVQAILLFLPLLSLAFSSQLWSSRHNPILLFLHSLKHISPDQHHHCCLSAARSVLVFFAVSMLLSVFQSGFQVFPESNVDANYFVNDGFSCCTAFQPHGYASPSHIRYRAFNMLAVLLFLSIPSASMVAAYAFVAFVTRARFDAFALLAKSLVDLRTHSFRAKNTASATPDPLPDERATKQAQMDNGSLGDLLRLLRVCRCPSAILEQVIPLLSSAQGANPHDVANTLLPQLQCLWMIQIRDTITLAKHNEKWIVCQAIVILGLLVPFALFYSIGVTLFPSVPTKFIVLPYVLFSFPFVMAVFMTTLGQFYIDRACGVICDVVENCSKAAEYHHREYQFVFDGPNSLAATASFCSLYSQRSFCIGALQMNFSTVARLLYYVGVLLFAIVTSWTTYSQFLDIKL
jgi:hypothetical protein